MHKLAETILDRDSLLASGGTVVSAAFLQALQDELANLVEAGDLNLSMEDNGQVLQAIQKLISDGDANYTAADVLAKLKTVDGANSGLDADLLDGQQASYYAVKADTESNLELKAPLASPELTGSPTAPTPSASDSSAKLATTAFVQSLISPITNSPLDNSSSNSMAGNIDSGYTKLSNGLILQWGTYEKTTTSDIAPAVYYPITFPTKCTFLSVREFSDKYYASSSSLAPQWWYELGTPGSTYYDLAHEAGFYLYLDTNTVPGLVNTFCWFALGY